MSADTKKPGMKIVRLIAENVKKLSAVEITPAGNVVQITGKNEQGKTSVLDSIWWALRGVKHIQAAPIRKGQDKARIRLELGTLNVERRFTRGEDGEFTTSLIVESTEGARFQSPQAMLDALVGELSFDPLAFARMETKKQFDELRRVAKVALDIDGLRALNKADYDLRTAVNRQVKDKRAQAEGIALPDKVADVIDVTSLVRELQEAGQYNTSIETERSARAAAASTLVGKRGTLTGYQNRIDILKKELADLEGKAGRLETEIGQAQTEIDRAPDLPTAINTAIFAERIEAANTHNEGVRRVGVNRERKAELLTEAKQLQERADAFTKSIADRETKIATALAAAQMPVAGLGLGAGEVIYNDIPFSQASSAEQLRVSMAIAMAANPKLRVIRITDGSLLDEDSMAAIAAMAAADDFQVWIEVVSNTGNVGVVIEDGHVASTPESRSSGIKVPALGQAPEATASTGPGAPQEKLL